MQRDDGANRSLDDVYHRAGMGRSVLPSKRTTRRGEMTRERIAQAAVDCFSEYGYTRTRISDIAHRANTSQGNVYRHFSSLDDVFLAILRPALDELAEATARTSTAENELTTLIEVNTAYLRVYARHRHLMRLLQDAASSGNDGFRQLWLDIRATFVSRTERWLRRLQEDERRHGSIDVNLIAEALGCMTEQVASMKIGLPETAPTDEQLDAIGKTIGQIWFRTAALASVDPGASARPGR